MLKEQDTKVLLIVFVFLMYAPICSSVTPVRRMIYTEVSPAATLSEDCRAHCWLLDF